MKRLSILIISLLGLASCKTEFVTQYRVTTAERSYYCNNPQFVNDTIIGAELKRNGTILRVFEIPYHKVLSVDYNGRTYICK